MYEYFATVRRIIDGDTIVLDVDLGLRTHQHITTRLAAINAPEMNTDEGKISRTWLITNLPGNVFIRTVKDRTEKYGRYLVWLWAVSPDPLYKYEKENSINMIMVSCGVAVLSDGW